MAETMGVGGLTGHLLVATAVGGGVHVVSETMGANVVADADRAAKGIAKQLSALFAKEGWITRGSRTEPHGVRPPKWPAIHNGAREMSGSVKPHRQGEAPWPAIAKK